MSESVRTNHFESLKLALDTLSMYEIPLYLQVQGVDPCSPPSHFSPLHYLLTHTTREKLLLDLMSRYHISPLLHYHGRSLFLEACIQHKVRLAGNLMQRVPMPTDTRECPIAKDISACFNTDEAVKYYFARTWSRRVRNAQRLFFLKTASALQISWNLATEIVLYI